MTIGENIKKLREAKGMTQVQLAEKVGVSQPYIVKIEQSARSPTIMMIEAIAKALGCTLTELLEKNSDNSTA